MLVRDRELSTWRKGGFPAVWSQDLWWGGQSKDTSLACYQSSTLILNPEMWPDWSSTHLANSFSQTSFESGSLQLTTHRLVWDDEDQEVRFIFFLSLPSPPCRSIFVLVSYVLRKPLCSLQGRVLSLDLSLVTKTESVPGSFTRRYACVCILITGLISSLMVINLDRTPQWDRRDYKVRWIQFFSLQKVH